MAPLTLFPFWYWYCNATHLAILLDITYYVECCNCQQYVCLPIVHIVYIVYILKKLTNMFSGACHWNPDCKHHIDNLGSRRHRQVNLKKSRHSHKDKFKKMQTQTQKGEFKKSRHRHRQGNLKKKQTQAKTQTG